MGTFFLIALISIARRPPSSCSASSSA
jgi:hypothetical protein